MSAPNASKGMRKINVLFMQSQGYFGSDSMIHSLIMRNLDRDRVNVHVACPERECPAREAMSKIPDIQLRPTEFGPSSDVKTKKELLREMSYAVPGISSLGGLVAYAKKHRIDVVHGTEKPRDALYGVFLARLVGARCVTHMHVKIEDWISQRVRWAMRQDDALLGVSEFVARSAVAKGYPANKVYYVLNSLDATKWDPQTDGTGVRKEFGIADDVPVLAILARLFPWKGHADLLKALAKAKTSVPNFKLLIAGEDDPRATPGGGSYMAELKTLAGELGLHDNVIFTGFRSDIAQILAASDVFAMPTFEEPCAVAFLEAMAMRKPTVALDSGGTPQLVDHGKAGFLSPPNDIDQLAANLVTMLSDRGLRERMGEYARARVLEYFTPKRLAREVEEVYRHVLRDPAVDMSLVHQVA
jgi:glycosyltransferase involved in cell wall biosynthesis